MVEVLADIQVLKSLKMSLLGSPKYVVILHLDTKPI